MQVYNNMKILFKNFKDIQYLKRTPKSYADVLEGEFNVDILASTTTKVVVDEVPKNVTFGDFAQVVNFDGSIIFLGKVDSIEENTINLTDFSSFFNYEVLIPKARVESGIMTRKLLKLFLIAQEQSIFKRFENGSWIDTRDYTTYDFFKSFSDNYYYDETTKKYYINFNENTVLNIRDEMFNLANLGYFTTFNARYFSRYTLKYTAYDYDEEIGTGENGSLCGDAGKSFCVLTVESFFDGVDGGVELSGYSRDYKKWSEYTKKGSVGSKIEDNYLDGIKMRLYGEISKYASILYRTKNTLGDWTEWKSDGQECGTYKEKHSIVAFESYIVIGNIPAIKIKNGIFKQTGKKIDDMNSDCLMCTLFEEKSEVNKLQIFEEDDLRIAKGNYFLTSSGIVDNSSSLNRDLPVKNKIVIKKADENNNDVIAQNMNEYLYNHKIEMEVIWNGDYINSKNYELGDIITAQVKGKTFSTVYTGYSFKYSQANNIQSIKMVFGKVRNLATQKWFQ